MNDRHPVLGEDIPLKAGTKVRYDGLKNSGCGDPEYGIVIHCWRDEELQIYDCLIAFFGSSFPNGLPEERPYILRYASINLTVVK